MLTEADPGIIFKFNYTLHREAFDVGVSNPITKYTWDNFFYPTGQPLDETNCTNGEYFFDDSYFFLFGQNRIIHL